MKIKCPECGHVVQCATCRGGDGSAVRTFMHTREGKVRGAVHRNACPGSWRALDYSATQDHQSRGER